MESFVIRRGVAGSGPTRMRQMALLCWAVLVTGVAWAIVDRTTTGHVSDGAWVYPGLFAALWAAALCLQWRLAPAADGLLLPGCALLNGLGVVMIHRIDVAQRAQYGASAATDAPQQLLWTLLALVAFAAVLVVVRDHRSLTRYTYTAGLAGVVLLLIPAALPARFSEVNGAKLWIRVAGFSIQPGEFAKLALTVFFAGYLINKRDLLSNAGRRLLGVRLPRGRDMGPLLAVWGFSILVLVTQKDLGMAVLLFGVFVVCLYVSTDRISWVIVGGLLFAVVGVGAYFTLPHVHTRVAVWLDPFAYPNSGYQMRQSLFGLSTGGLFGTGLGGGHPELVPLSRSDFIIAAFGEELGAFGLVAILCIYALILVRGVSIALLTRDNFGRLLAAALVFTLGWQVFIVTAGVTNLLPETGLATPFLSYGGSSLVANLALIAMLVRMSDRANSAGPARQKTQAEQVRTAP